MGAAGPRGRPRSLRRRAPGGLLGRLEPNSRRSTFEYILKPEVVAMDRRRCGLIKGDAGRDVKAVERQIDHVVRL